MTYVNGHVDAEGAGSHPALSVIYAATEDDKRRKAFRARINYFQRAKVLGDDVEVGKGKQNAYSIVQIECGLLAWN